jgi:hypothetical protein
MTHESHFIGPMARFRSRYELVSGFDVDAFIADLYADSNFVRQGLREETVRSALDAKRPHDYPSAVRAVFSAYADAEGKELYGDKTPGSVTQIVLLAELFPEAKFVHIIRDGRAVALSYLERPEWGPETMAEAAHHWKNRVRRGRAGGGIVGTDRYMEVRYEDVVVDPEAVARAVCAFLGLSFEAGMLRSHEQSADFIASTKDPEAFKNLSRPITSGLRDWQDEISDKDRKIFEAIAGDLLVQLGYPVSGEPPDLATRARLIFAAVSWQRKRVAARISSRTNKSKTIAGARKDQVG